MNRFETISAADGDEYSAGSASAESTLPNELSQRSARSERSEFALESSKRSFATVVSRRGERQFSRRQSPRRHPSARRSSSFFELPQREAELNFIETSETVDVESADVSHVSHRANSKKRFFLLTLAALGVIYGDIGTSPLYAYSSALSQLAPASCTDDDAATPCDWPSQVDDGLGILSLMLWSITLVVTIQYVAVVLALDNHGEGGTMALAAHILDSKAWPWLKHVALWSSVVGTGFVLGDGCFTPAISVLSAIEGIALYEKSLEAAVAPISCVILFLLFSVQRFGTNRIGFLCGPIILIWFLSIGSIGIWNLTGESAALAWSAWNPAHIVTFFGRYGSDAWFALGNVVLTITGVEAMFADLGHFGAGPVRVGWLVVAYPCLVLNYMGQAAHVFSTQGRSDFGASFYLSIPPDLLWPMIVLATLSTLIASQALISGAFSLLSQTMTLDLFPRMLVVHTSASEVGQIYMPLANATLMVITIVLVAALQHSKAFANAYGVAVTAVIVLTSLLTTVVLLLRYHRHLWSLPFIAVYALVFTFISVNFFAANIVKFVSGGWIAILIGGIVVAMMILWKIGRAWTRQARLQNGVVDLVKFKELYADRSVANVARPEGRVGIFMSSGFDVVPVEFARYADFASALAEVVIFVTVENLQVPFVSFRDRVHARHIDNDNRVYWAIVRFGFAEQRRDVREVLLDSAAFHDMLHSEDDDEKELKLAFYVAMSRVGVLPTSNIARRAIATMFAALASVQSNPTERLQLPPESTIEIASVLNI